MDDNEKYRKLFKIVVIFMILTIIVLAWRIARMVISLVNYDVGEHVRVVRVETEDTGDDYEDLPEDFEVDLDYRDHVYDDKDIDERSETFLSGLGERYKSIIKDIKRDYKSVYTDIEDGLSESDDYEVDYEEFSKHWGYGNIDLNDMVTRCKSFVIKDSLTAIGFFNNVYVIYAYDYPVGNALVVMDYKDVLFSTVNYTNTDFGSADNLYIKSDLAEVVDYDNFTVMYVKGES